MFVLATTLGEGVVTVVLSLLVGVVFGCEVVDFLAVLSLEVEGVIN